MLPPPEEASISAGPSSQEKLWFHDRYAWAEQVGLQVLTSGQAMGFRLIELITLCTTSPMWRTMGLIASHALTYVVALFFKTEQAVVEKLAALPWNEIFQVGKKILKLAVCMYLDVLDFFIGRIPGFGILFDIGCACICAALGGSRGWWVLWEVVDMSEQFDAFMPTCTLIALRCWNDA